MEMDILNSACLSFDNSDICNVQQLSSKFLNLEKEHISGENWVFMNFE